MATKTELEALRGQVFLYGHLGGPIRRGLVHALSPSGKYVFLGDGPWYRTEDISVLEVLGRDVDTQHLQHLLDVQEICMEAVTDPAAFQARCEAQERANADPAGFLADRAKAKAAPDECGSSPVKGQALGGIILEMINSEVDGILHLREIQKNRIGAHSGFLRMAELCAELNRRTDRAQTN